MVAKEEAVVYPPRDTEDWIRCPLYLHHKRQGWRARSLGYAPNLLLGTVIGDGLSAAYRAWDQEGVDREAVALQGAFKRLEQDYEENPQWTLDGLKTLVKRGITAGVAEDVPRGGTIIRVDTSTGVARPDLIHRDRRGDLCVTDTKVTLELDARWLQRRLEDYEVAWQLWHNAWETQQLLGEPVKWTQVHLIALTPKCRSVLHPIEVTPERMAFWLKQAEYVWKWRAEEDAGTRPVLPNWLSCQGRYGRCEFFELDHTFHGDLSMASMLYERSGATKG